MKNKIRKILIFLGVVNSKKTKIRLLHPIGLFVFPLWVLLALLLCLFTNETIITTFVDFYCIW